MHLKPLCAREYLVVLVRRVLALLLGNFELRVQTFLLRLEFVARHRRLQFAVTR